MPIPELCVAGSDDSGSGGVGGGGTTSPGMTNSGAVANTGWPTMSVVTDLEKSLDVQLYTDRIGEEVVDLTNVAEIKFIVKEMLHNAITYIDKTLPTPGTPADGIVTIALEPEDLPYAGMWYAAVITFDADGDKVGEYPMWFEVRKGVNSAVPGNNPINIAEIRLMCRDSVPEMNALLLEYEFSDTEIAFCIMRPVEEWNEALPPVTTYTGATFPWRENWRKATTGYLMRTAARKLLRDDLEYSAGGLAINDKRKWDAYAKMGDKLIEEWRTWMKQKKVQLNSQYCYGTVGSRAFSGWRV